MFTRLPLVLLLTLLPLPALAQNVPISAADRAETSAVTIARLTTASSQDVVQGASVFSIEGSTADEVAAGQVGFQFADFTLSVGTEAPLGKSSKSAVLADLNGLRSKTTGKVAILWTHWNYDVLANNLLQQQACVDMDIALQECSYLQLKRAALTGNEEVRKRFQEFRRRINPGTVYFGGVNGQVAPEDFNYINAADLSPGDVRHVSWSVAALGGVLLPNSTMIAVNYKRQNVYSANDTGLVCSPIAAVGSLQCSDQILGPPGDPASTNQTAVEVRKIFNRYFAISPKLTQDWTKSVTGIVLPLYFFRDSGGGLNGGISLGWRSDTKAFSATAFIGQVLGVITR